ncbi:hypothetical protein LLEC1_01355 [Akanthomyces lecanii]|uniref:Uncharacterized protein n=1 Tax=Cordyceps confragosa TaxID=2714763 RepID=A0A179IFX1_CORDF|nr:hypothetical protein LLEC1_01355 [Akanthomyces lecanii]
MPRSNNEPHPRIRDKARAVAHGGLQWLKAKSSSTSRLPSLAGSCNTEPGSDIGDDGTRPGHAQAAPVEAQTKSSTAEDAQQEQPRVDATAANLQLSEETSTSWSDGAQKEPDTVLTDCENEQEAQRHETAGEAAHPPQEADSDDAGLEVVESLWDRAYVTLRNQKKDLVTDYEALLSRELPPTQRASGEQADGNTMTDQKQLHEITSRGLERMEKHKATYTIFGETFVVKDQVAQASQFLLGLKDFVSDAIKVSPEASLAWAGVCIILPLFTNPSTADEAQSSGFGYVTSRIRFYVHFEELLWPKDMTIPDESRKVLEDLIEDLYVKILMFQLTSIIRFYRGWLKQLGRDMFQYDGWKSMLESVKEAERTMKAEFMALNDAATVDALAKMTKSADEHTELLKSHLSLQQRQLELVSELVRVSKKTNESVEASQSSLHLPIIGDARFDSAAVQDLPRCLEGTRGSVKARINTWIDYKTDTNLFWLCGPAGTGKTTVARTVADWSLIEGRLAATHFFSSKREGNELYKLFPTLASQFAKHIPEYKALVRKELANDPEGELAKRSLSAQYGLLFERPLANLVTMEKLGPQLIVIDSLDECGDKDHVYDLLELLVKLGKTPQFRLCILLTSRSTDEIDAAFGRLQEMDVPVETLDLHLHYSKESREDVKIYLEAMLKDVKKRRRVRQEPWPDAAQMEQVVEAATTPSPLFIYASTLEGFLMTDKQGRTPRTQLEKWLLESSHASSQLSKTYKPVLQDVFQLGADDSLSGNLGDEVLYGHHLLSAIILGAQPLSTAALAGLLGSSIDVTTEWLIGLRAVLDVRQDSDAPVQLLHKSFSDYMLDGASGGFRICHEAAHEFMAGKCFTRMRDGGLKRNICRLDTDGRCAADVDRQIVADYIPEDLGFAAKYCLFHVNLSGQQAQNLDDVYDFLTTQLLQWLEALSLLGSLDNAVLDMTTLAAALAQDDDERRSFVQDASRFVLSHSATIAIAPLQVYTAALLFSPVQSLVKQKYQALETEELQCAIPLPPLAKNWSWHSQTLEPPSQQSLIEFGLALSKDGSNLAAVFTNVIHIYSTTTWQVLRTFQTSAQRSSRALDQVTSSTFTRDGCQLVTISLSHDTEYWDWSKGIQTGSLPCIHKVIECIKLSDDDAQLVHFTYDGELMVQDVATGAVIKSISVMDTLLCEDGIKDYGSFLAVIGNSGETRRYLAGQSFGGVSSGYEAAVAYSVCGRWIAHAGNGALRIYDAKDAQLLRSSTFSPGSVMARSPSMLSFFEGGSRLSQATCDGKLRIWDVEKLTVMMNLDIYSAESFFTLHLEHRNQILTVMRDGIQVLDMAQLPTSPSLENDPDLHCEEHHWPCIPRIITTSPKGTARVWDITNGSCIRAFDLDTKETPSPRASEFFAMSANGRHLVSSVSANELQILDIETGSCLSVINWTLYEMINAYSPDGRYLVALGYNPDHGAPVVTRIMDVGSQAADQSVKATVLSNGHTLDSGRYTFSPDSKTLAARSEADFVHVWREATGWQCVERVDPGGRPTQLAFSPDGRRLAVCTTSKLISVWDLAGASAELIAEGRGMSLEGADQRQMLFSESGQHLGFYDDEDRFLIWDIASGAFVKQLQLDGRQQCLLGRRKQPPTGSTPFTFYGVEGSAAILSFVMGETTCVSTLNGVGRFGPDGQELPCEGYSLSADHKWVTKAGVKTMFIPQEYSDVKQPIIFGSILILYGYRDVRLFRLK